MSRYHSSTYELKLALKNIEGLPERIDYQQALQAALKKQPAKTRLASYLDLRKKVGEDCDWLNDQIGHELSCNGKYEEALAYWKGRFFKHPGYVHVHQGLESALNDFPPARCLKEVKDLEDKVEGNYGASWIKKQYVAINIAMGNYEDSLEILYKNWKSDQANYQMKELTKGLEVAVEMQPDVVMGYLARLARYEYFDLDLFMRVQAKLDYEGDWTSYLENYINQSKKISEIERCYAYVYLGYIHEHKHKHRADQRHGTNDKHRADPKERASRSHSANRKHSSTDRSHSASYIPKAIHQSDRLGDYHAKKVLEKLLEYDFPGQAEELCLQRMKKDPSSSFVEEFIKLKKPRDDLEAATLLYDINPEELRFAMKLLRAIHLCKTHAIAAEICKKILLSTRHNKEIRTSAIECLARELQHVQIQPAIDTWRDLIMKYPKDGRLHSNLTSLLSSKGNIDQKITVWKGLADHLKDAKYHESYEEAKQQKKDQAKQKEYEAKQKRDQAKLQEKLRKKFGDKWDTICAICMVNDLDTALVNCGHVCCGECAKKLNSKCHIYRSTFAGAIKVHARLLWVSD